MPKHAILIKRYQIFDLSVFLLKIRVKCHNNLNRLKIRNGLFLNISI
ncbi:hypothetical protein SPONN_2270 [uncultured Candidatus Thioglobus sp.]|nr:hypothetical protein SPONN_2270 [uncultured Candidatus Thioglobus sp.]